MSDYNSCPTCYTLHRVEENTPYVDCTVCERRFEP